MHPWGFLEGWVMDEVVSHGIRDHLPFESLTVNGQVLALLQALW